MRVVSAVVAVPLLLATAAIAGNSIHSVVGRGADAATSVAQISDTLGNLLKSLQDEGGEAQALFHKRRRWCDGGLRAREKEQKAAEADLAQLQGELREREKVLKEAEVTVSLAEGEVAKVQESIAETTHKEFHNASSEELAKNVKAKREALGSLQNAVEAALPNLAQLQEGALEVKKRLSGRSDSVRTGREFIGALKEDCIQGQEHADAQAAARSGELSSIQAALQVLEELAPALQGKQQLASNIPAQDASDDVSFVQWSQDMHHRAALLADEAAMSQQQSPQATVPAKAKVSVSNSKIDRLVAQLKAERNEETEERQWCSSERQRNELVLRHAQDSLAQLQSGIKMHADAEAQLKKDLGILQKEVKALDATAKWATGGAKRADKLTASVSKNHRLAAKILEQATSILVDIEHSGGLRGGTNRDASTAAAALMAAKESFVGELQDSTAAEAARRTAETATAASRARTHEIKGLEVSRDRHESERARGTEDESASQAEVEDATAYLETLKKECKSDVYAQRVRERSAQIRALKDAEAVLSGKKLETNVGSLPAAASAQNNQNLSPMERAAAEMHMAVDDN